MIYMINHENKDLESFSLEWHFQLPTSLPVFQHPCRMVIWDQSWTHKHQVTTDTCTTVLSAGKRQLGGGPAPGSWSDVKNMNDAKVQKALGMVVDRVNIMVNSMYRLTESQIVSVKEQVSSLTIYHYHHHHHHHHILFRASFPLQSVGLIDKSSSKTSSDSSPLRTILRVSRVHIYGSFFLSFFITSFHDFLGLSDLFCAITFSLRTSEIQPVLRSTCPNHHILLVRSSTSKSWMPSFVRRV